MGEALDNFLDDMEWAVWHGDPGPYDDVLPGQLNFKGEEIMGNPISRTASGGKRVNNWSTQEWFVRQVEKRLGIAFDLDVMADESNAVCEMYIDEETDAMKTAWECMAAWCNPPDKMHGDAVLRAIECGLRGDYGVAVLLVRCTEETEAWDIGSAYAALSEIVRPRLNYIDPKTGKVKKGISKHSTLFYFTPESIANPREDNERVIRLVDYVKGVDVEEGVIEL